jgi:phytoene desaturase
VHKPGRSITEFLDVDLAKGLFKLDVFTSMKQHVRKYFKHPKLIQLMEFPVLFLGALPKDIPALYSLMNYADIKLGTWYPQGGMFNIAQAMHQLAVEMGVTFLFNNPAEKFDIVNGVVKSVNGIAADVIISGADYHHVEAELLPEKYRSYSNKYWQSRTMAPSSLLYYVGLNKKLTGVTHHSLFFDVDFEKHGAEIYDSPQWPTKPLFYASVPSVTDKTVAPNGCENLFFLIPIAAGLEGDDENVREQYFQKIISRYEEKIGQKISDSIIFKRTYSVSNFKEDYNAFKGNAYGLANTLMQTSILKPSLRSKKISNLYYTGQLTVPGPGVPPSLISGEVVAKEILKEFK